MLLELAGTSVFTVNRQPMSYIYWGDPDILDGQPLPRKPSTYTDDKGCLVAFWPFTRKEADIELSDCVRRCKRRQELTDARNLIWRAENVPSDD